MRPRVDEVDRGIPKLPQDQGRMPWLEMARRLGHVSARTVRNKPRRLVTKQIVAVGRTL